jgi:hypothetical protein
LLRRDVFHGESPDERCSVPPLAFKSHGRTLFEKSKNLGIRVIKKKLDIVAAAGKLKPLGVSKRTYKLIERT